MASSRQRWGHEVKPWWAVQDVTRPRCSLSSACWWRVSSSGVQGRRETPTSHQGLWFWSTSGLWIAWHSCQARFLPKLLVSRWRIHPCTSSYEVRRSFVTVDTLAALWCRLYVELPWVAEIPLRILNCQWQPQIWLDKLPHSRTLDKNWQLSVVAQFSGGALPNLRILGWDV